MRLRQIKSKRCLIGDLNRTRSTGANAHGAASTACPARPDATSATHGPIPRPSPPASTWPSSAAPRAIPASKPPHATASPDLHVLKEAQKQQANTIMSM